MCYFTVLLTLDLLSNTNRFMVNTKKNARQVRVLLVTSIKQVKKVSVLHLSREKITTIQ